MNKLLSFLKGYQSNAEDIYGAAEWGDPDPDANASDEVENLKFIINHVFLPPQLPQKADEADVHNHELLNLLLITATHYQDRIGIGARSKWTPVLKMLESLAEFERNSANSLDPRLFIEVVQGMCCDDVLALHIGPQNAGLIMRQTASYMIFESFEASPLSEQVLMVTGKLRCSYPGPAIAVELETVKDMTFLIELATFLEKMKKEPLEQAAAKASRAGGELAEERETASPKFITELLTGILRGLGHPIYVNRIEKRIADEVLWDNAKVPWRRSPLWLVARVALQTTLRDPNAENPDWEYKSFMVYFMARVLERSIEANIATPLLFVMNAKLSRRVYKLQGGDGLLPPGPIFVEARRVGERAASIIDKRWKESKQSNIPKWNSSLLNPSQDINLTMRKSREFLKGADKLEQTQSAQKALRPDHEANRIDIHSPFQIPELGKVRKIKDPDLADFEVWVRDNLDEWLKPNINHADNCIRLSTCIKDYATTIVTENLKTYTHNAERMSVFFLTVMELWVALDKLAVMHCPLLMEYPPRFADGFLNPLLLPQAQQRIRLFRVELYITGRRNRATRTENAYCIFSKVLKKESFAVQYYEKNALVYKELEREIEQDAERAVKKKKQDLDNRHKRYQTLKEKLSTMECEYFTHWKGWTRHDRDCSKCALGEQIQRMKIEVFEWPLPHDELQRKAVLFELRPPLAFSVWRDTTYRVLTLLCQPIPPAALKSGENVDAHEAVDSYPGLKKYYQGPAHQTLKWTSSVKSHLQTHYRLVRLPTTMEKVVVNHAPQYALRDSEGGIWTYLHPAVIDGATAIRLACSFKLPEGPYKKLQYVLNSTTMTPNQILARQWECPADLQIHEYVAFGLIRAGYRLQWLNILRELRSRTLTFSSEAVNMLLAQCAWQVGPTTSREARALRDSHIDLGDESYGKHLLAELNSMLDTIQSNWQEVVAAQTLIMLAVQLLEFSPYTLVTESAITFLRRAREVCSKWAQELSSKLHDCPIQHIKRQQVRVVQAAAVCRETYNVGKSKLESVLRTKEDLAIFVQCATMIYDNVPTIHDQLDEPIQALLSRDRRLSHEAEEHIRFLIDRRKVELDLSGVWDDYEPSVSWSVVSGSKRWVSAKCNTTHFNQIQRVEYNLRTGQLLVDGLPLGRLPSEYVKHPTYLEVFGEKLLDVYPAKIPGMIFESKTTVRGDRPGRSPIQYKVGFAMLKDKELVIRTSKLMGGGLHQLIPRKKFEGDFPRHIIANHVFWLDLTFFVIELRDFRAPWTPKPGWCISAIPGPRTANLLLGNDMHMIYRRLIDVESPTAKMVSAVLSPLEVTSHIEVSEWDGIIQVHLPRLNLDFSDDRTANQLKCKQFPGMVVDDDADIGTLIGLENRLVVRNGSAKSVMIPYGKLTFEADESHHVRVKIDTSKPARVKYHLYTIDKILGRLVGNGSLASHLFKIYLHAVTSSCVPDPLTGRTGTEEALALFRSAATWSFQTLEDGSTEAELLSLIAGLAPVRVYYPRHLTYMQSVRWSNLSPISQHDDFAVLVQDVADHASRFQSFEQVVEGSSLQPFRYKNPSDLHLSMRAICRGTFRAHDVDRPMPRDKVYVSRDVAEKPQNEALACHIASVVLEWPSELSVCRQLMDVFKQWRRIGENPEDDDSDNEMEDEYEFQLRYLSKQDASNLSMAIGYDQQWLNPDSKLPDTWLDLYRAMVDLTEQEDRYKLVFLLSTLAYSGAPLSLVQTLLAFATNARFQLWSLQPPGYPAYDLERGFKPNKDTLLEALHSSSAKCTVDFEDSEEYEYQRWKWEGEYIEDEAAHLQRRMNEYMSHKTAQLAEFVKHIINQWPCSVPTDPQLDLPLVKTSAALHTILPLFTEWYRNMKFEEWVTVVQKELDAINSGTLPATSSLSTYSFSRAEAGLDVSERVHATIKLNNLLYTTQPLPILPLPSVDVWRLNKESLSDATSSLGLLLQDFAKKNSTPFEKEYLSDLEQSAKALAIPVPDKLPRTVPVTVERYHELCQRAMETHFQAICDRLVPKRHEAGWMIYKAGMWPKIKELPLLQCLATCNASLQLPPEWKETFVYLGRAIAMFQRSERLLAFHLAGKDRDVDYMNEMDNTGHEGWDPMDRPDWLLMEVENNLLIRPVQAQVAHRMISPPDGKNTIMQLCMGEGKTSVIVPIVASTLADGKKLVRVVVLKPLSGQMFQMLVQKLGGLVNRRVFYMPFSRGMIMGPKEARMVKDTFKECMSSGGILLVQPEHILSFKLLGLERLYNSESKQVTSTSNIIGVAGSNPVDDMRTVARTLIETQKWLVQNSRDILDESDEILSIRHELIYSIGTPKPIQNHPDRWVVVQELLDLIRQEFLGKKWDAHDFEVEDPSAERPGGFHFIRILNMPAGRRLLIGIAQKLVAGKTDCLHTVSFRRLSEDIRSIAVKFITDPKLRRQEGSKLLDYYRDNESTCGILFLLRGLIAHNILIFTLQEKRWKVDYGLDARRTMLAVPYRAKDMPSGRSEFSHPDVIITLTCLSYYYGGLSENQLDVCFRNVYKSDNPTMEYERWLKVDPTMPRNYEHLNSINLEDRSQWKAEIYPRFRYNKAVIDFYLSGVVFPKEAKEFEHKLSTSGWDIAETKIHSTTGFSGTNDNQYLLPISIKQNDTEEQKNTNAKVLGYLLQPENGYMLTAGPRGERLSSEQLLNKLTSRTFEGQPIRVVLDVGAQVLEWRNEEFATNWLKINADATGNSAEGAVFFNENDELTVIDTAGIKEPLRISAFANSLTACLVYLDDAHTRGTDLKLPPNSRAAVTLGPNLTKDRLVQACMRMRKLGNGHSVLFCSPPEIDRKIRAAVGKHNPSELITVKDVLYWSMQQTCQTARKLSPVWAKQGLSYLHRSSNIMKLHQPQQRPQRKFPVELLERESKSLEEHYGFDRAAGSQVNVSAEYQDVVEIYKKCEIFGVKSFSGAPMLEEQERELSHEVESQREVVRPPKVTAVRHRISADIRAFIDNGKLDVPKIRASFTSAFDVLKETSAKEYLDADTWDKRIYATNDFAKVIGKESLMHSKMDDFLRPVNWILSSRVDPNILILISPFEANDLMPLIRRSQNVVLHVYSPRTTKATPTYEGFDYYYIPSIRHAPSPPDPVLIDQLNIFAGQLYFRDYEAYKRVCDFLGLYLEDTDFVLGSDGFVAEATVRIELGMGSSPLAQSPVGLLRELVVMRRKGQSYLATHMGNILHGRLLRGEDF